MPNCKNDHNKQRDISYLAEGLCSVVVLKDSDVFRLFLFARECLSERCCLPSEGYAVWISVPLFHPPSFAHSSPPFFCSVINREHVSSWMMQPEPYQQMRVRQRGTKKRDTQGERQRDKKLDTGEEWKNSKGQTGRKEGTKEKEIVRQGYWEKPGGLEWKAVQLDHKWQLCTNDSYTSGRKHKFGNMSFYQVSFYYKLYTQDYKYILIYPPKHCYNKPTHLLITAWIEDTDSYAHAHVIHTKQFSSLYSFIAICTFPWRLLLMLVKDSCTKNSCN